jgi:hypothetical protein
MIMKTNPRDISPNLQTDFKVREPRRGKAM